MKIFLIVLACIVGWICCSFLSALIARAIDWDGNELMAGFCLFLGPLVLIIEIIVIPFMFIYGLIEQILGW